MKRKVFPLYATVVAIWGTTWYAIKLQFGLVDPAVSVGYRFLFASLILFAVGFLGKRPFGFDRRAHFRFLIQGVFLFSLNYVPQYYGAQYVPSGINAVLFSSVILMNILHARLFLKTPITREVVIGAALGLTGILLVFVQDLFAVAIDRYFLMGSGLIMLGVYFASLGNIAISANRQRAYPIVQSNAFAMLYGACFTLLGCLFSGKQFAVDLSARYVGSFVYLAVFGSVVAFGAYARLIGIIGPTRSSYATVLFPLVALSISTYAEHFHWTPWNAFGVVLILLGNFVILSKKAPA